jgi:signal transduction histidine kinase
MFERVVIFSKDGRVMGEVPARTDTLGWNAANRSWYKAVSSTWRPHVSSVYHTQSGMRNIFSVAVPIRIDGGEVAGILLLHVDLERFFDWIPEIDLGPDSKAVVLDAADQVAFHPRVQSQAPLVKFQRVRTVARHHARTAGVDVERGRIDPDEAVAAYVPAKYGWGIVTQQSTQAAYAVRDAQLKRTLIDFFVILASASLAIYFAMRMGDQRRRVAAERQAKEELERQVAERTRELERTNKDLEEFSYSVSHDLRAPLRGIDGYAKILEEDHGERLGEDGRRLTKGIRTASAHMAQLIQDLLDFARFGRGTLEKATIDMTSAARSVAAELLDATDGGAARPELVVGELPAGEADAALIRQVWRNLIGNAIKYSSRRADPRIEIGGNVESGERIYWVKDNGAGFDMRYYDKLFGVFQRLHGAREFGGTGVGLAIVHRIVTRHGGRVWAQGEVDAGATFYFSLPGGHGQ